LIEAYQRYKKNKRRFLLKKSTFDAKQLKYNHDLLQYTLDCRKSQ